LLCLLATPAFAWPKVIPVGPPTGNDTTAIQAAFNLAVKSPGSTVLLSAGTYHTTTIYVRNFDGTFRGAGEDKTYIDTVPGTSPLGPSTLDTNNNVVVSWPSLYCFEGGNVRVSDMTAKITNLKPAQFWNNYGTGLTTALGNLFQVTGIKSASFTRVTFHDGSGDDADGFNVTSDIGVTGRQQLDSNGNPTNLGTTGGSVTITACSFVGDNSIFCSGLTRGSLTVSGNVLNAAVGCIGWDASDSQIAVSDNRMACGFIDVQLVQGNAASYDAGAPVPATPAPRCLITGNDLTCGGEALVLADICPSLGFAARLAASIANNHLDLGSADSPAITGVGEYCTQNITCLGNRFSGYASCGLALGDDQLPDLSFFPVSGWSILGNDFHNLTTPPSGESILLGHGTTHNLVVGGRPPTSVLNEGTHNILINVTLLPDPAPNPVPKFHFHLQP
jgi:hypothetical protein